MIVLVANLGSTSFKYKLFDMPAETVLATGEADRIGQGQSAWALTVGDQTQQGTCELDDHAQAVDLHLAKLVACGALSDGEAVEAIGFKAVHGGPISGAVVVDDAVLATMESLYPLAPAHNPPYVQAMRSFKDKLPHVAQVAAFETAFHADIPLARQVYGVPHAWIQQHGVRRYGFHGASNASIAARMAQVAPTCSRIINLHLGGSSSVCAIKDGKSVAHSMGATPQTGTFHANRVGDFDPYAVVALKDAGMTESQIFEGLSKQGGLLGLSGVSADFRDVQQAATAGNAQAQLALDAFVESCRHYVGAFMVALGGVDAITFTAGIGQHNPAIRQAICKDLAFAGVELDDAKNTNATGKDASRIDTGHTQAQVWIVPTNEELIVARQTQHVLTHQGA